MIKKIVRLCLFWLVGLSLLPNVGVVQSNVATEYDFIISDYQTHINVQDNGDLAIKEKVLVQFNVEKHGIFRSIPFRYHNLSGVIIQAPITNVQVKGHEFQTYKEGDNLIVKIGSANTTVIGDQEYNLSYDVKQGVRQYSGYQELYRNVAGPGRAVPIKSVSFIINYYPIAGAGTLDKWFAYYGDYGSRDSVQNVNLSPGSMSGVLTEGLAPYQAVTVGLKFPSDHFALLTAPDLNQYGLWFLIIFLIPLITFIRCYRLRSKYGKDYPIPTVVSYYPPDNMTPVEYLVYLKRETTPQDMVSLIYLRASKGYIQIEQVEGDPIASKNIISIALNAAQRILGGKDMHVILKKIKSETDGSDQDIMNDMLEHEKILYRGLFTDRHEVDISIDESLYTILENASDQINSEFSYKKLYTPESSKALGYLAYVSITLFVLFLAYGFGVGSWFQTQISLWGGNDLVWVLPFVLSLFATLIILIIFFAIIKAKTKSYEELLSKLRGYKTFIEKVEKPQLQALIKDDPFFIDKTLPYAVVLGLATGFLKVSEQALGHAYHPIWFLGNGIGNIGSVMSSVAQGAWVTPPASEGSWSGGGGFGSGGGGFSGGGGGGGGGGSW